MEECNVRTGRFLPSTRGQGRLRSSLILAVVGLLWVGPEALAQQLTANVWVNSTGGSCTRSSSAAAYSQAASCGSFAAAYSVANGGDTIRIKAGTYGQQRVGGTKTPAVAFIGESGTQVINNGTQNQGLHFYGNVSVANVNVGGVRPFVSFDGANNTWESSRMLEATGLRTMGDAEPILIYSDSGMVTNTTLRDLVIETQKGALNAGNGDVYHLEMIRIDQNVNGVLIDRVTFESCANGSGYAGCGSGQIFITTPNGSTYDPTNIVIRNSIFKGSPNYGIQIHSNVDCANFTLAYNVFKNEPVLWSCGSRSNIQLIGNVGPRPQTCLSGITYTKNVWQHSVGSPCGTDTLVIGPSFSVSALGLDSNYRPVSGSRVIGAGEESYCRGALGSVDRDGNGRPSTGSCTAGAYEFYSGAAPPSSPTNLRVLTP